MINYDDEQEHQATAKEHAAALVEILKQFLNNNTPDDVATAADVIEHIGEALQELHDRKPGEVVEVTHRQGVGFIIK